MLVENCTVDSNLPVINRYISLVGNGNNIIQAGVLDIIFEVSGTGNLTLNDVNFAGDYANVNTGIAVWNDEGAVTYNGGQVSGFGSIFGPIVNGPNSQMTLNGVTIVNNLAQGGGGILNAGGLAVNNSYIGVDKNDNPMPNQAGIGGGIYNFGGGELSLNNTVVAYNDASDAGFGGGGGVYNENGGRVNLNSNSLIKENYADIDGGGIYNDGVLNVNRANIQGNMADDDGGGVFNGADGVMTVNRGIISNNTATMGAGVYNAGTLTNYKFGSITGNNNDDVYNTGTCLSYGTIGTVSSGSCAP